MLPFSPTKSNILGQSPTIHGWCIRFWGLLPQEMSRQAETEERERRTRALVKAEIGTHRRATVAGLSAARTKIAQTAEAERVAQLTQDMEAIQAATGLSNPQ